jgi:DNA primase
VEEQVVEELILTALPQASDCAKEKAGRIKRQIVNGMPKNKKVLIRMDLTKRANRLFIKYQNNIIKKEKQSY